MPARLSSPIPAAAHAAAPGVLAVAACAVLAGARSLAAIGEWAADAPALVLAALGVRRHPLTGAPTPPAEATVRRVLGLVDPPRWTR